MKKEYNVRTFNGEKYNIVTANNKREALRKAKILSKDYKEVVVFTNVIGDDFGIYYPDNYGIIKEYLK